MYFSLSVDTIHNNVRYNPATKKNYGYLKYLENSHVSIIKSIDIECPTVS